jgi:exopolyphosphatase/guanosine-5'-triphosphate,3'-diphosphate pyrophosphatase
MTRHLASLDIGTHTARLLVAQASRPPEPIRALARKRAYIRLTQDMDPSDRKSLSQASMDRAVAVVEDLLNTARAFGTTEIYAIATGVIREAANRERFLERILETTGVQVRTVSGEEEAFLTGKGVLHGLGRPEGPFVVFDLGGGSTEFLFGNRGPMMARSLPLGAAVLTRAFLRSDPPSGPEMAAIAGHADEVIGGLPPLPEDTGAPPRIIGTGGTAVTLAVMVHGLSRKPLTAETVNGLTMDVQDLSSLFEKMKSVPIAERRVLPGLDPERADIILAGTLVVLRIMNYFHAPRMTVSMSDLLEGILISVLEETGNGGKWDSLRLHV